MVSIPLLLEDFPGCLSVPAQTNSFGGFPVNRAFAAVAQEVVELLKQSHSSQTDSIDRTEMIMIRAIEPEYKEAMAIEPLTARELEVLQLIVDGHSNLKIAGKLYITLGTVKTHVRNIFKKFYVNDRTQAAILALRAGLVN